MSLSVGKFFVKAIKDHTSFYNSIGGRLFPVARTSEDEALDKIPYIIMRPVKVVNENGTKDMIASPDDTATIELDLVAQSYSDLVDMAEQVRGIIEEAYLDELDVESWPFILEGYDFSADEVLYDPSKPCYYQTLRYMCQTTTK